MKRLDQKEEVTLCPAASPASDTRTGCPLTALPLPRRVPCEAGRSNSVKTHVALYFLQYGSVGSSCHPAVRSRAWLSLGGWVIRGNPGKSVLSQLTRPVGAFTLQAARLTSRSFCLIFGQHTRLTLHQCTDLVQLQSFDQEKPSYGNTNHVFVLLLCRARTIQSEYQCIDCKFSQFQWTS